YLMDNTLNDSKYVIFTSWIDTLEKLEECMIDNFGKDSLVMFHKNMDQKQLQISADKFQDDPDCNFILCDELGGEGRNFQNADAIIHVDLPWSPMKLEQRIGRLDRIGRDKDRDVLSVVFYAQETIEEYLLEIWDQGLNIFSESVSGIEIAIEDIYNSIIRELSNDIKYGLKKSLKEINNNAKEIRETIEEERYYDAAKQLDYRLERQLSKLIETFDKDGGEKLFQTMMSWTNLTGLVASDINYQDKIVEFKPNNVSIGSMKNTFFIPPNMEESHKHLSNEREVKGTFSRDLAINHEDLIFFAPGDPFFDSIVNNAKSSARGRSTAIAKKSDLKWQGFVFTWSPKIDKKPLLKLNKDIVNLIYGQGYLALDQIITIEPLSEAHKNFDKDLILDELSENYEYNKDKFAHLGKRGSSNDFLNLNPTNLLWFKDQIKPERWNQIMNTVYDQSKKKAEKQLNNMVDLKKAKNNLEKHINGLRSSNMFYETENYKNVQDMDKVFSAIYEGLKNPNLYLDSIAFFWMEDMDE
ncbi:MAG: helicase-related protein, partial [bacterium]